MPMVLKIHPVLLLAEQTANSPDIRIRVPQASCRVIIDGVLSPKEWETAARVTVPSTAQIYFQQSAEFVYIFVPYTNSPSGMVDLFLSPRPGEVFDLHTSAKLGERQLHDKAFPNWNWWNNRDWTANVSQVESFDSRTFRPAPIREYQIRRSGFPTPVWVVRFELTPMETNNETLSVTAFPSNTTDKSTTGWIQLNLEPISPTGINRIRPVGSLSDGAFHLLQWSALDTSEGAWVQQILTYGDLRYSPKLRQTNPQYRRNNNNHRSSNQTRMLRPFTPHSLFES